MGELTRPLEPATRKKIDLMLNNLGWNTDEELPTCNVFTERAKTKEQNKKFKGKNPDYVLYQYETDKPIGIIEAKRKGESIDEALNQAIERYAIPLGVKIVFAYDGAFFKSWHIKDAKELVVDGQTLTQLIPERKILRFIQEGYSISEITPKIKHTRAELINIFKWVNKLLRREGIREGMDRFTEFANFLFLKLISEMEEERERNNEERILPKQYSWNAFAKLEDKLMLNYINNTVLPYLGRQYNHSGDVFERELAITNPKTLKEIVDRLSEVRLIDSDSDVKGDAFEYFLKTSITIGNDLGEYFTPRHLVNLMIDLTEPKFGEKVYDPTCGTGGFLIASFNYIKKRCANTKDNITSLRENIIFGRELTSTARIAKMNMILTGDGHNNIKQLDSLKNPVKEEYDLVLANPPYGQQTHYGGYYPVPSNSGDAVFIQHIWLSLKEGGRAAVVIPEGLLFRSGAEYQVRNFLLKNSDIKAIISLPQGVFRPYAKGNKTNIIIFEKNRNGTKSIWFYDLKADGFDLESDMRRPVDSNDIPDLLSKWSDKAESEKSWNVSIDKIIENNYDLLISTYKPKDMSEGSGLVKFSTFATPKSSKIKIDEDKNYKQIRVQLYGNGAVLRSNIKGKDVKTKIQNVANTGDMIVSKIDARNGALAIISEELDNGVVSSDFPLFVINKEKIDLNYLNCCLKYGNFSKVLESHSKGTTNRRRVKPKDILNLSIYLPNKTDQEVIATRILKQENIISNADATIQSLKEGIVDESDFKGDYTFMDLEGVCEDIKTGGTPSRTNLAYFSGNTPWVKISDMKILDYTYDTEEKITKDAIKDSAVKMLPKGTVLVSIFATIDAVSILGVEGTTNQAIAGLIPKENILPEYLMYYLHTLKPYYISKSRGIAQKNINLDILKSVKIPVPPKPVQKQIVEEIETRKLALKAFEDSKKRPNKIIQEIMKEIKLA